MDAVSYWQTVATERKTLLKSNKKTTNQNRKATDAISLLAQIHIFT